MTKDHDLGVPDEEDLRRRKETLENSEIVRATQTGFMVGKILHDENGKPYDFQILTNTESESCI